VDGGEEGGLERLLKGKRTLLRPQKEQFRRLERDSLLAVSGEAHLEKKGDAFCEEKELPHGSPARDEGQNRARDRTRRKEKTPSKNTGFEVGVQNAFREGRDENFES